MNVLLITVGSAGDVHPFIGVGLALRGRGHAVTVAASDHFGPLVQGAGLEFIELGRMSDMEAILDNPDLWHPRKGFRTVFEFGVLPLMRPTYQIIADFHKSRGGVVVSHGIAFGSRVAQETLGVPLATVHLAPAVLWSAHEPPVLPIDILPAWLPPPIKRAMYRFADAAVIDPVLAKPINSFRAEFGLPPVKRIMREWWLSPERVIGLFPEWYATPQPDWPAQTRLTGFPLYDGRGVEQVPPELAAFLDEGDPPILATAGSAMKHGERFFAGVAEACQRLGKRAALLTCFPHQLPPDLPAGVRHFEYAPFSQILPRCAAFIHHGGIGTTAQGLAAGVPQLICPFSHDQYDNAARVTRLGAGGSTKAVGARAMTQKIRRVLSPEILARCREVAGMFRAEEWMARTCGLIEELAPIGQEA